MTLQELQKAKANIKRGCFFPIRYETLKNGLTKKTKLIARFVQYSHINGVIPSGKKNENEQWQDTDIVFNSNTQKFYLQFATTNTRAKAISTYYNGEIEITKEEYEQVNKPRKGDKPVVMRIAIENIRQIG